MKENLNFCKESFLTPVQPLSLSEPMAVSIVESYLAQHYDFRRNILSGKYEYALTDNPEQGFQCLTAEAWNGIVWDFWKNATDEIGKQYLELFVYSSHTPEYDPIEEYLANLPQWDGKDRVTDLFRQIPDISDNTLKWCATWMRSAVAHWLRKDTLHGNEAVLLLIGSQGCGKSTFCKRMLPMHLRQYYLDHLNLSNKHDKEMALSSNLFVNIDEFEQIKPSQQAELKHCITKSKVNGRPIYGRAQEDRNRYASFLATTNCRQPLKDATGSRRYIVIDVPDGKYISNDTPIDYDQLYAQLVSEVNNDNMRYWFINDEVKEIEQANAPYQQGIDIDMIVNEVVVDPNNWKDGKSKTMEEIMSEISARYPRFDSSRKQALLLGAKLRTLGFRITKSRSGLLYNPSTAD